MNEKRELFIPLGSRQEVGRPSPEIYAAMGEENIFAMMADFYGELEASEIRNMFPKDMARASRKSAAFFVGLLGGPPLYHQKYGRPMMRRRHMPFAIDEAARQVWLTCFDRVLDEAPDKYNFPPEHLPQFRQFLAGFSLKMVNTA
jgi:hemoglobin